MTDKYGLLGRKLGHSWSPQIHGLLAGYDYGLYEVEPPMLESFLRETTLSGMNVTIPYKKEVLPFCSTLSPAAQNIGSVNTLVRTAEGWHGDNTDYAGFIAMVRECGVSVAGLKTLVFGSGGASLAVIAALRDMGACPIVNVSRTGKDNYDNLSVHSDARILVNTTPLGMYPDVGRSPVSLEDFPRCEAVFDIVYNPARTKLLLEAEKYGIPHAGGLTMLVAQAKRSSELFTGSPIPDERVGEIVRILQHKMQNVILIGMPGCGKTTVGKILAERLGRLFVDMDEIITQDAGMSIPNIFETEGEAGFRLRETAALESIGKESGLVIATGGGCVTRAENYPLLHQNGIILWIQRDLSVLPTDGRPLSQKSSAKALYDARKDQYAFFADHIIISDEIVEHTVSRILEVAGQ